MNILITGGVGFIGSNCALYFGKNKKNHITLIDDFSKIGVERNAFFLKKNLKNIDIIKTDFGKTRDYLQHIRKSDVIIHLAGQTAVTSSIKNPAKDFRSNLEGGFSLLEAVRKNNPKAIIIYSSTNKVYGDLKSHKIDQDKKNVRYEDKCHSRGLNEEEKLDFISPYGCSKGALDLYFLDYQRIYGLNTVVFRQSCIYGPHQIGVEDQGWVAYFSKQFLKKGPLTIFGDGYQVRDLLYVEDLIDAYDKAIKNIGKVRGLPLNIGGGISNSYSLLQVISLLEKHFEYKIKINFAKTRLGDQKYFVADNKKVGRLLDWRPKTQFKKGLIGLLGWQKDNL